jgi:hypothetical protein
MPPKLDYVPRLVDDNNRYLVRDHLPPISADALWSESIWWTGGVVLDQEPGQTGDPPEYDGGGCVGHGVVGEALASPVRVTVEGKTASQRALNGHHAAVKVYARCKEVDEWEGVDYEGTSVRAGMLTSRERGWCKSFIWAKNMDEVRRGLQDGTGVIGVVWTNGMFDPDDEGFVVPTGTEAGGHCIFLSGFSPRYGKRKAPTFRARNSWSQKWSKNGNFYIEPENLDNILFGSGGECAFPVDRELAPLG